MQQKCSMGFSGVYQFLYLIWGFFRKSLQVQGIIFGFKLWLFTRLGGLSKFHAMPIFTVQVLKVRKIFGMWVKYSFMPWTRREKVTATIKISCHEKVYNRCENISCREQFQSPWNWISRRENLPSCEKVTVSGENLLIQRKHFTFPFY